MKNQNLGTLFKGYVLVEFTNLTKEIIEELLDAGIDFDIARSISEPTHVISEVKYYYEALLSD